MFNKNYNFVFYSLILALVFLPRIVMAGIVSYVPFADSFILPKETVIKEDYYVFGGDLSFFGTVEGDMSVLGGEVVFNGSTSEDAFFVSSMVEVNGAVGDDLRLLSAEGIVKTSVPGDVVSVSAKLTIDKDSRIFGSLLALSGELFIDGEIAGDIKVYGDKVFIDGFVGGDVKVVGQDISFGKNAKIAGDIIWAGKEPVLLDGAVVLGEVRNSELFNSFFFSDESSGPFFSFFLVLKSLMALVVLLIFSLLFSNQATVFAEKGSDIKSLIRSAVTGLVLFMCLFIVGVMLLVSAIGSLLGALILAIVASVFIFSIAGGALLFGRGILALVVREGSLIQPPWKLSLVGVVGMFIFGLIPILGPILAGFFLFASFGNVVLSIYHILRPQSEISLTALPQ